MNANANAYIEEILKEFFSMVTETIENDESIFISVEETNNTDD